MESDLKDNHGLIIPNKDEKLGIKLYDNNKDFIGDIDTTIQLYEVRCQIKENNLLEQGQYYYIDIEGKIYGIDMYGRLDREALHHGCLRKFDDFLNRLM